MEKIEPVAWLYTRGAQPSLADKLADDCAALIEAIMGPTGIEGVRTVGAPPLASVVAAARSLATYRKGE